MVIVVDTISMSIRGLNRVPTRRQKSIQSEIHRIGASIQLRRQDVGMTQEELAEALDVSVNTITYIETGRRIPSLPMMILIVRTLKMELVLK